MSDSSVDYLDFDEDEGCPNCGGEGIIYCCEEPWACLDPDEGCDLCERRCDWCRPLKKPVPSLAMLDPKEPT